MGGNEDRQTILNFLKSQPMATISTIDESSMQPESALIAFAELDNLEVIFETYDYARKYTNLGINNKVALVIGWDTETHITLQYEGTALPISEEDTPTYRDIFLQKDTPCTEEFLLNPRVKLFKIQPSWIRYSDYTTSGKPKIIELSCGES